MKLAIGWLVVSVLLALGIGRVFAQQPPTPPPPAAATTAAPADDSKPLPADLAQQLAVVQIQIATLAQAQRSIQKDIDALNADLARAIQAATPAGYQLDARNAKFVKVPTPAPPEKK